MRTGHCLRNWPDCDDGTAAAAVYFLHERGYTLQRPLPQDEVIRFCVEVAEEAKREAEGEPVEAKTIAEIADWLRGLVEAGVSEEW